MASTEAVEAFAAVAGTPAVVTIDLHRGHLDPEVATLPLPADASSALVARTVPLLDAWRDLGVPIVHVITSYRDRGEIVSNPYWRVQADRAGSPRARIAEHNLEWLPGVELMPGLQRDGDLIVDTKKRYDCFLGTDLDITLRARGVDSLLLLGVNTNSCVIATAIQASVRDYAVFVVEDGVDTMLGPDLHEAARRVVDASFGWFIDGRATVEQLRERQLSATPT